MRSLVAILLMICLSAAFLPSASADTPPTILWPSEDLTNRANASNLTLWFASQLGVTVDESRPGGWQTVDEPNRPDFLRSDAVYVLHLDDGEIEAKYIKGGALRSILLLGNTTYEAESDEEASLKAIIDTIAFDLGLDTRGSELNIEIAIIQPGTSKEVREWHVQLVNNSDVGTATFFNSLSIVVRVPDLRVISVYGEVWYELPEGLDNSATDAIEAAEEYARSEHDAVGPNGTVIGVAVRNQTGFAFHIFTSWPADPVSDWNLETWVDASTGEILFEEGPNITTFDTVPPPGRLSWIPLILIGALVVLIAIGLFYRLTAERALDHFTRGRILGYVQAYPGNTYTYVRKALGLTVGTFSYHLWVLERLGFIRSVRQGRVKLLYPQGKPITQSSLVLSELQFTILDLLKSHGDMSQTDISQRLGISRQRVHYNVKKLRALNLIKIEKNRNITLSLDGIKFVEDDNHARKEKMASRISSNV